MPVATAYSPFCTWIFRLESRISRYYTRDDGVRARRQENARSRALRALSRFSSVLVYAYNLKLVSVRRVCVERARAINCIIRHGSGDEACKTEVNFAGKSENSEEDTCEEVGAAREACRSRRHALSCVEGGGEGEVPLSFLFFSTSLIFLCFPLLSLRRAPDTRAR